MRTRLWTGTDVIDMHIYIYTCIYTHAIYLCVHVSIYVYIIYTCSIHMCVHLEPFPTGSRYFNNVYLAQNMLFIPDVEIETYSPPFSGT